MALFPALLLLAACLGVSASLSGAQSVLGPAEATGSPAAGLRGAFTAAPRDWLTASSLLQAKAGSSGNDDKNPCTVCIYVLENKAARQPYLCRGLKEPSQQKICVYVLLSMFWWMDNVVYWTEYGCQKTVDGRSEYVKPCPASAQCSWIKMITGDENGNTGFCDESEEYSKPE